ncbi:MAG: M48 family metalloprotease [Thermaerobacter sp.]|nr:M48 family metalloprotease [Thermaerobacter sp.]
MSRRQVLSAYSHFAMAILWTAALAVALAFALISGLHHLLWLRMRSGHPATPIWLWLAVALLSGATLTFWYRIVSAAVRYRRQRRQVSDRLAPLLQPFPQAVQDGVLMAADWYLIDDRSERYAFTWGGYRPRVGISRGLWDALDGPARRAVMYHEAAHALVRDPLQQTVLQVLSEALRAFGMQALYQRYLVRREIVADTLAVSACGGDDQPLLSALLAAAGGSAGVEARVGLTGALEARVRFLETRRAPSWWDRCIGTRLMVGTAAIALTVAEGLLVLCR